MPHIHTNPGEHDATVSAYIVRLDGPEPRLLLHLHKNLNRLMQFGEHVELRETPWQALIHEIQEESGYSINQLKLPQPLQRTENLPEITIHPQPVCILTHKYTGLDHLHNDTVYAFVTDQKPSGEVGEGESGEMRLLTRAELESADKNLIIEDVRKIGLKILDEYVTSWQQVNSDAYGR